MSNLPTVIKTLTMQRSEIYYARTFNNGEYVEIQDLLKDWLSKGKTLQHMAYHLGTSDDSVRNWIKRLDAEGFDFGEYRLTTITQLQDNSAKEDAE